MTELRQEERKERFNDAFDMPICNPGEPHMACVLLLDTSSSMDGDPIDSLNNALRDFKEKTSLDEFAQKRVDVAIVEFNNGARVVQDFTPISKMKPVTLVASGCTDMGAGINLALDLVEERNRFYDNMGTPCFKPWVFMITDGLPTDDISAARERIKIRESKGKYGKLKFWSLGVPGYSKEVLTSLSQRNIELKDADFSGIFNWLSESMVAISVSRVDENTSLPNLPNNAQVIPDTW